MVTKDFRARIEICVTGDYLIMVNENLISKAHHLENSGNSQELIGKRRRDYMSDFEFNFVGEENIFKRF